MVLPFSKTKDTIQSPRFLPYGNWSPFLGNNHTFLSSHPAPGKRADRLEDQLSSPEKTDEPSEVEGLFIMIKNLFVRLILWIASLF